MAIRKLKIEVQTTDNQTMTLAYSGRITEETIEHIIAFLKGLIKPREAVEVFKLRDLPIARKIQMIIESDFRRKWFTSRDLKKTYEETFGESVKISTVSTYLVRLWEGGFLVRKGNRNQYRYRLNC